VLTELQRRYVWEDWLSAQVRGSYFADLVGRHQRWQRIITWATLVSSSSAFVTIVTSLPASLLWTRPVLAVFTAALSLWSLIAKNERCAIECSDLHFQWNSLAREYQALWEDIDAEWVLEKLKQLRDRSAQLSKTGTNQVYEPKLMLKWQEHVELQYRT
jgi:hypothetical protein